MSATERGGPGGQSLRRILSSPACRALLTKCGLIAAGIAGLVLLQWSLLATIITAIVQQRVPPDQLLAPLVGMLAAWLVRAALVAERDRLAARASTEVRIAARADLIDKVLLLGPEAVRGERAGELVNTGTEGVSRLDAVVARFAPGAVTAVVVPTVVLVAVLVRDFRSGLILVITGPLLIVFLWLVGTWASRSAQEQWSTLGRLGALLVDALKVLPTLVMYGRARAAVGWLGSVSEAYRISTLRVLRTAFLSGFVLEFGAALCTALVAVTVGVRLFEGQIGLEVGLLVLLLTPEFFAPLRALGADHHARLEGAPAADRLYALLDTPVSRRGNRPAPVDVPDLRLHQVTFRRDEREVLHGLDLDLPPRSRTALVGASGSGKSTIAHLLLGFATPDEGAVLVNGIELSEIDPDSWRNRIAYVPERPWLLPGTVAANVRIGRPDADDAAVREALRRAQILELVEQLPLGVDEPLGEDGARLSGGERLRIALARVFVADPAVVVLDEPTSHLDTAGEAAVLAALSTLGEGRTVLTISHREAPLAGQDRVLRLANGTLEADPRPVPA